MNPINIQHQENDDKGIFTLTVNNQKVGEMFYKHYPEGRIDIKHTEIDPNHRGKGLALYLIDSAADLARQNQWVVSSTCPYAAKILVRDSKYQDVFKG